MDPLLQRVEERIERLGLKRKEAAEQIGVTGTSLERHLEGAYVRSDSLAKYRGWLEGRQAASKTTTTRFAPLPADAGAGSGSAQPEMLFSCPPFTRDQPFKVVDLFSGCGGMSLGFDLLRGEADGDPFPRDVTNTDRGALPGNRRAPVFQTILALDIEEKVVSLHNQNHHALSQLPGDPARWVNIADFVNAAEMLAFYLDHLAARSGEETLARQLDQLPPLGCAEFKDHVRRLDAHFLEALASIRSGAAFRHEYGLLDSAISSQTSVLGFHEALGLPETSTARPLLGPLVWGDHGDTALAVSGPPDLFRLAQLKQVQETARARLSQLWDAETGKLRARTAGSGRGQLASSAGRIGRFLAFLQTQPMQEVKAAWLAWRSLRDALRQVVFGHEALEPALRSLYTEDRRVDVLLGGPPCQGFSRIGRGKIRSLREDQVHVEADPEAGDVRNLLLLKYVEFISALEPALFLFENVRHFQARVQTPEGTFLATEILNDAIAELSQQRVHYRVTDRIVDCSRHAIPQTRERYVMVGVRSDRSVPTVDPEQLPQWCLDLPVVPPVPLRVALSGLPAPLLARGAGVGDENGVAGRVAVSEGFLAESATAATYRGWVRMLPNEIADKTRNQVDAHTMRAPRADDQAFFSLLGPGQRWMDYRCDDSPTLGALRQWIEKFMDVLEVAKSSAREQSPLAAALDGLERQALEELLGRLDGSLSIRLLLEGIAPQEGELGHHLLTSSYLAKREGNNGDWIARLHPDRPAKTIVSHMAKDTYAYVHPSEPRTLSVREAARIQTFPDWFCFGSLGLVDAFRAVGNAVPPLLSYQFAGKVARLLWASEVAATQAGGSTHEQSRKKGTSTARRRSFPKVR